MKLNIGNVINCDGASLDIHESYDPGSFEFFGNSYSFEKPIEVTGEVKNIGGALRIILKIKGEYNSLCDRCACDIKGVLSGETEDDITRESDELDGEMFVLSGYTLDIKGALDTLLYSSLPMVSLCKEDCRGLCPKCGTNLNLSECNCDTTRYDPRFAIFRKLSENGEV